MKTVNTCPACGQRGQLVKVAGDKIKCKACGDVFGLPMATLKTCSICGIDISDEKRVKDDDGRYFCKGCWATKTKNANAPAPIPSDHVPTSGLPWFDKLQNLITSGSQMSDAKWTSMAIIFGGIFAVGLVVLILLLCTLGSLGTLIVIIAAGAGFFFYRYRVKEKAKAALKRKSVESTAAVLNAPSQSSVVYAMEALENATAPHTAFDNIAANSQPPIEVGVELAEAQSTPYLSPAEYATAASTKPCPHCAETIQSAARKCRFCGERLDEIVPEPVAETNALDDLASAANYDSDADDRAKPVVRTTHRLAKCAFAILVICPVVVGGAIAIAIGWDTATKNGGVPDLGDKEWIVFVVGLFVAVAVAGVLWQLAFGGECPRCGKLHAMQKVASHLLDRHLETEMVQRTDRHYNSNYQFAGSTERQEAVLKTVETRQVTYLCKYCLHAESKIERNSY